MKQSLFFDAVLHSNVRVLFMVIRVIGSGHARRDAAVCKGLGDGAEG
jgi:hypothetical protein